MPKRTTDTVLNELQRVKQQIYRIRKQGYNSNAVRAFEHQLKLAHIDISKPSKLTDKDKIKLHKLINTFDSYKTSSIRNIKKIERETDQSINKAIVKGGGEALTPAELSIVYGALTKAHEKLGKLSVDLYSVLGYQNIIDATSGITNDKTLSKRFNMATRFIEAHAEDGDYTEEQITNILKKGRYLRS